MIKIISNYCKMEGCIQIRKCYACDKFYSVEGFIWDGCIKPYCSQECLDTGFAKHKCEGDVEIVKILDSLLRPQIFVIYHLVSKSEITNPNSRTVLCLFKKLSKDSFRGIIRITEMNESDIEEVKRKEKFPVNGRLIFLKVLIDDECYEKFLCSGELTDKQLTDFTSIYPDSLLDEQSRNFITSKSLEDCSLVLHVNSKKIFVSHGSKLGVSQGKPMLAMNSIS